MRDLIAEDVIADAVNSSGTLTLSYFITNEVKMSLDPQSLQHFVHDIPAWAQYAAQGLAAETAKGISKVSCRRYLVFCVLINLILQHL